MALLLPTQPMLEGLEVNPAWQFWRKRAEVTRRVGAVALSGSVSVRHSEVTVASADAETLGEMSSGPPVEFTEGISKYVIPASITPPRRCDRCQNGSQSCHSCSGRGRIAMLSNQRPIERTCRDCGGTGSFPCAACSGTQAVHDFQLVSITDERVDLTYTYLPDLPFELEEALYTEFEKCVGRWETEQQVGLQQSLIGNPYRGGQGAEAADFHGFDYAEALDEARRSVDGKLRGREPFSVDALAHVVPILISDHGGTDAAHFCLDGELVTVTNTRVLRRRLPG